MNTEQKAEAYDNLIERLKDFQFVYRFSAFSDTIDKYFPELRESEDERIRKKLIAFLKTYNTLETSRYISWLEKQVTIDEEKVLIGARKDVALSIMNFLDKNTLGMCLSNMECEDLEDAVVNSDWSKVYNYMRKKLEKQDKQKPYGQRKECSDCQFNYAGECKGSCQMKRNEIDKDKAEIDHCFTKMMNCEKVSSNEEEYNGEDYGIDSLWHAKNILEKTLGKVDGYQTDDGLLSHQCAITAVKKLYKKKPVEWSEEDERIYQSIIDDTVQENQLDSKQIDWLKSIKSRVHPKQEWSEEDKVRIEQICDDLECGLENFRSRKNVKGLHFEEIIESNIDWLKSLKYRIQPKQEWNEDDESLRLRTIGALETCKIGSPTKCVDEQINWLKSLKGRVQPKQEWSDEDETERINTIIMLKEGASLHFNKRDITKAVNWIKSLKQKIKEE